MRCRECERERSECWRGGGPQKIARNAHRRSVFLPIHRPVLSPTERRLAYDSLPLYEAAVRRSLGGGRGASSADARRYAADVAALLAPVEAGDLDADPDNDDGLALERAAWEWTALLFVGGRRRDGALAPDLSSWLAAHEDVLVVDAPTLAGEAGRLASLDAPETDPAFWPTVARAAAVGAAGVAVDLLGAHSAWADALASGAAVDDRTAAALAVLEPVGLLLRRWPRLGGDAGGDVAQAASTTTASAPDAYASMSEFQDARRAWLNAVRALAVDCGLWARAEAGDGETAAGSRAIVSLLCGDAAALEAAAAHWPELMVARALHGGGSGPRGAAEVAHAATRAATDARAADADHPAAAARDHVLLGVSDAAARGEPASAAAALSSACGAWLQAHAAPLLAVGAAKQAAGPGSLPHAEWVALEYAAALAASPATRAAAARVLALCPGAGRAGAAALFAAWGGGGCCGCRR